MMQPTKGTKDYPPEEKILRNKIVAIIQRTFELYGFAPLETATLEPIETLTAKYAGGDEIVKEIYKLKDQGKRNLGLRYDLTVPLARFIGENPNIKLPFKRYEIGKVFRDGPIKAGRLREFWQCDGDVIGTTSMLAEAELLKLSNDVFVELNMNVVIKVNNRKLLNGIMTAAGITNKEDAILTLDKLAKIGAAGVKTELKQKGFDDTQIKELLKLTQGAGNKRIARASPLPQENEYRSSARRIACTRLSILHGNHLRSVS
ncbi:ATP phosphoribosyltransferase regulatory subunit [Candidatus Woesearchaeota archaeon]|nr:ATP phosphoribosyltransferase regulatory subunit [Candidatus Woesearchaeota archaeon]